MTADGLFPGDLFIQISLFNAAFDHPLRIPESISAHAAADGGSNPSEFTIIRKEPFRFQHPYSFRRKIRFYLLINIAQDLQFILFYRRSAVSVFATTSFTGIEITYKLLFSNLVTDQYIIYGYQGNKLMVAQS